MYEYGTLKPVDVMLRTECGRRENNGGDEPNERQRQREREMSHQNSLYNYQMLIKMF
jgi:hypothetical protein